MKLPPLPSSLRLFQPRSWRPAPLAVLAAVSVAFAACSENFSTGAGSDADSKAELSEGGEGGLGGRGPAETENVGGEVASIECAEGRVLCDDTCINPKTNTEFCGAEGTCTGEAAGTVCFGEERCEAGRCVLACPEGTLICDATCVAPRSDALFCGAEGLCDTAAERGEYCDADEACVAGTCRRWRAPEEIAARDGLSMGTVGSAMNDAGEAIAYWYDAGMNSRRFSRDFGWSETRSFAATSASTNSSVALLGSGEAVLVRSEQNESASLLRHSHLLPEALAWSSFGEIEYAGSVYASYLSALPGPGDSLLVAFIQYGTPGSMWVASRPKNSLLFGQGVQLDASANVYEGCTAGTSNVALVAWQDSEDTVVRASVHAGEGLTPYQQVGDVALGGLSCAAAGSNVLAITSGHRLSRYDFTEEMWQSQVEVLPEGIGAEVVAHESGRLLFVGREVGEAGENLLYNTFDPESETVGEIRELPLGGLAKVDNLVLRTNSAGDVLLVFRGDDEVTEGESDQTRLYATFYEPLLDTWSPVTEVPSYGGAVSSYNVHLDREGRALVVFVDRIGDYSSLWATRFE